MKLLYSINNNLLYFLLASGLLFGPFGFYLFGISINQAIMVLLVLINFVTALIVFRQSRLCLLVIIMWIAFLVWTALLLPVLSSGSLNYALSEARSLAWVLLIIPVMSCLRSGSWSYLLRRLFPFVIVVSIVIDFVYVAAIFGNESYGFAVRVLLGQFALTAGSVTDNIFIGPVSDGSFRVMWIFSIILPFYLFWAVDNLSSYLRAIALLILGVAIIASGSRALIGVAIVMGLTQMSASSRIALIFGGSFAGILSVFYLFPSLFDLRIFSLVEDFTAGSARGDQATALFAEFLEAPLLGRGFGFYSDEMIRNTAAPYSYEYTYLSLLTKIGFLGLLWLGLMIGILLKTTGASKQRMILLLGFFLITATNPYLWTLLGVFCFCFCAFYPTGMAKNANSRFL